MQTDERSGQPRHQGQKHAFIPGMDAAVLLQSSFRQKLKRALLRVMTTRSQGRLRSSHSTIRKHRHGNSCSCKPFGTMGLQTVADEVQLRRARRTSMHYLRKRPIVFWSFACLILLSGCSANPLECDSFETRNAVLKSVSDDHNNALVKYAAQNPNMTKSSGAGSEAEKQKPLYLLSEKIVTTSARTSGR
jgi:hypothetical protein